MRREEEEEKVASLLGGLERIEAPAGFENRVMRHIAKVAAGEEHHRPALLLVLKFAAPAAALLLMGAMFAYFADREVSNASVPPVQDLQLAVAKLDDAPPSNASVAAANTPSGRPVRAPGVNTSRPSGGALPARSGVTSEDFTVQGPGEIYTPPGLDPRPRNVDPSTVSPGDGIKVGEVLSFIGISAACDGGGCRVTSLSQGSPAERAKLNVGDRIVSIDGRPINVSTAFSGPTSFKTFQVVRGGRTMNVPLSSN